MGSLGPFVWCVNLGNVKPCVLDLLSVLVIGGLELSLLVYQERVHICFCEWVSLWILLVVNFIMKKDSCPKTRKVNLLHFKMLSLC